MRYEEGATRERKGGGTSVLRDDFSIDYGGLEAKTYLYEARLKLTKPLLQLGGLRNRVVLGLGRSSFPGKQGNNVVDIE